MVSHFLFLEKNFLKHCERTGENLKITAREGSDEPTRRIREFLEGVWLELYVYDLLNSSGEFDEVILQANIFRGSRSEFVKNEIDVIAIYNSCLAALSCKTEKLGGKKDKEVLYELDSLLQADLMGLYAKKVLITNQKDIPSALKNRAKLSKIEILTGRDFPDLAQRIKKMLTLP